MRRSLLLLVPCLLCLLVWLAYHLTPGQPPMRSFVSRRLAGGTRYTFQYPDYLTRISEDGPGAGPEVAHNASVDRPLASGSMLRRAIDSLRRTPVGESITVVVIPVHGQRVLDGRRSETWVRGEERRHNEFIDDARTQTRYWLYYSCPVDAPAVYARNHQRVASSFRVLRPVEALPAP